MALAMKITRSFQATAENIVKPAGDADTAPLEEIIAEAKALNEADYTPESWETLVNELEECEDMLANIKDQTANGVEEQIGHLREAIDNLVKAEFKLNTTTANLDTEKNKTTTLEVTTNLKGDVKWESSDVTVATVDEKGVVTAVKAGKTTITATLGERKVSCEITVTHQQLQLQYRRTPTPVPATQPQYRQLQLRYQQLQPQYRQPQLRYQQLQLQYRVLLPQRQLLLQFM